MKFLFSDPVKLTLIVVLLASLMSCSSSGNRKSNDMKESVAEGDYEYDVAFFFKDARNLDFDVRAGHRYQILANHDAITHPG